MARIDADPWWTLAGIAVALAAVALALLMVPAAAAGLWPWPLSGLTARMTGATLVGVALLAASVVRTDDRRTGRVALVGLAVCAGTALVVEVGYGRARWRGRRRRPGPTSRSAWCWGSRR